MINKLTVKDATVVYLKANTRDSEGKSVATKDNTGSNDIEGVWQHYWICLVTWHPVACE